MDDIVRSIHDLSGSEATLRELNTDLAKKDEILRSLNAEQAGGILTSLDAAVHSLGFLHILCVYRHPIHMSCGGVG